MRQSETRDFSWLNTPPEICTLNLAARVAEFLRTKAAYYPLRASVTGCRQRRGSKMSRSRMSRSRLAQLSHAQLVVLAAEACEGSRELKNKADALIAQVAPLPAWCVDILLSPDLLPQLFSSLGLSEHAAAGVCSSWSRAYSRQLRRCRYIDPRRVRRLADVPEQPNGLCMLPGGVLAITSSYDDDAAALNFVAARNDTDPQALAACLGSTLAAWRFKWSMGMARTNDGLLACNLYEQSAA